MKRHLRESGGGVVSSQVSVVPKDRAWLLGQNKADWARRMMMNGKTYGTVSPERQKAMSGLEFVQGLANGALPLNTIAQT